MSTVKRTRRGIVVRLSGEEASLVKALMEQLQELLGDPPDATGDLAAIGIAENAVTPEDPVLARLFPDAYREDGAAAGEFRRYTEMGLREGKREAADVVLDTLKGASDTGVETVLDQAQAQAWLKALNDVRLALGTRLDIGEDWYDEVGELDPGDPRMPMYAAYDWLTMVQESLVRALW
ncbi:DUF2017 domain-containing protein [Actinomadura macrotermitis]|uniref:DUF2017 domain-containing protein n=1 Tax=Actinomadura macrotermitis TaxID=2585200 RepID=UPI002E25DE83